MPRGGRRPNSGRKKGSKNNRLRRMLAIDAVHVSELARQHTEDAVKTLVEIARKSRSENPPEFPLQLLCSIEGTASRRCRWMSLLAAAWMWFFAARPSSVRR